jgi:hypothetical protein
VACIHYADVFNEIIGTLGTGRNPELILGSWGQGSEGSEDYCPSCGQLGVAYFNEANRIASVLN